ncbi:hypothetical protein [Microbacterium sp.]|uniref:hypothetical protein n=1 Tax=Microbacterium sp. TaxID=51671 RepID=UPI001ACAA24A|nr:hypothetical protein [Microbacterium sp.]MBN9185663.1 hypothetical protein [Microbacterium sp.]MBN9188964.1 hypothetical protein [Microbacterium sp.]MBN9193189.1 hypothetical protein [Microbacterium sp.]
MEMVDPRDRRERSPLGGLLTVATLQVFALIVTYVAWLWNHLGVDGRCETWCDTGQIAQANALYLGVAGLSFVLTIIAGVISHRTRRDLMWVPLVGAALIVAGYFLATAVLNSATGG